MENRGLLNWRNWPAVRKAQVIGGVTGALLPLAVALVVWITGPHDPLDFLTIYSSFIFMPAELILESLGLREIYASVATVVLMLGIDSFVFSLAGTAVGWLLGARRTQKV